MRRLKEKIEHHFRSKDRANLWLSLASAALFFTLFLLTIGYFFFQARHASSSVILDQTQKLQSIFKKIDDDCTILGFDLEKTYINFLTVKSFVGSEVGSMNLEFPERWKGPYVESNLTIQGIPYYVLKSDKGHYIVPGDGVILSTGKILGKDIIINAMTDVDELVTREKGFQYNGKPLIVKLPLKRTEITPEIQAEAYGISIAE